MATHNTRWAVTLACAALVWGRSTATAFAQDALDDAQFAAPEAEPALEAEAPPEAEAAPDATLRPSRVNTSAPLSGGERWVKRNGRWALQRINYRYLDAPDYAPRPAPPQTIDDFATLPNVAVVLRSRWFGGPTWPGSRWGTVVVSPFGYGFGNWGYGSAFGLGYGNWPAYGWGYGGWNGWNGYGWNRPRRGWGFRGRSGLRFGVGLRLGSFFGF